MTLGLAASLLYCNGFDGSHVAGVFIDNFDREPWRGYDAGPPQIFNSIKRGVPLDAAAGALYGGTGSFGNGAAMRVAPVALFASPDLEHVSVLARLCARITHTHEWGVEGAVLQACALGLVLKSAGDPSLNRPEFVNSLAKYVQGNQFRRVLDTLAFLPSGLSPRGAADQLGNGIEAHRSVPLAIYAFLENVESFPNCIRYAIKAGGDTDTIASMAGALAGARAGEHRIPTSWKSRMEGAEELCRVADALERVSP